MTRLAGEERGGRTRREAEKSRRGEKRGAKGRVEEGKEKSG